MGHFHLFSIFSSKLKLAFAPLGRTEARRAVNHDEYQADATDKFLVFGCVQLVGEVLPGEVDNGYDGVALAKCAQIKREILQNLDVEKGYSRGPKYHAGYTAETPENYHRQYANRYLELE